MNIQGAFSGYSCSDIAASKKFYGRVLGFHINEAMGGFNFVVNGHQVFIYQKDDHQPATFTVLNLVVDNINEAIEDMRINEVIFERYDNLPAPQDESGVLRGKEAGMGPDIAWFKDPSGNILALVEE